ncbi:MAG: hypothetical protein LBR73_05565 [Oscillospiraceae bacterium]|jgi:hypothetical protein|nr:hypothetical protein [Oscillospiraceae bacterium]
MAIQTQQKRRHGYAFPLGFVLLVLAIIGAVFLLSKAGGVIKERIENPPEKAEYEAFLKYVVMDDPDPFDSVDNANPQQLIDICIWSLTSKAKPGLYPTLSDGSEYDGSLVVKKEYVEQEFKRIFGEAGPQVHMSVEGSEYDFIYDDNAGAYYIPVTGQLAIYTPRVEKIEHKGDNIILDVDYIGMTDMNLADENQDGLSDPSEPLKKMVITLYKNTEGGYYLGSIQAPEDQILLPGGTRLADPTTTAAPTTAAPTTAAITTAAATTA